jgi:hypothetical protein
MTIDEELPQRVCQTIGAAEPMRKAFFNPKEFFTGTLLPQGTSFTATYRVFHPSIASHSLREIREQYIIQYLVYG